MRSLTQSGNFLGERELKKNRWCIEHQWMYDTLASIERVKHLTLSCLSTVETVEEMLSSCYGSDLGVRSCGEQQFLS